MDSFQETSDLTDTRKQAFKFRPLNVFRQNLCGSENLKLAYIYIYIYMCVCVCVCVCVYVCIILSVYVCVYII